MARFARVIVPGYAYHVTHRGNRRGDVFFSDDDRRAYLQRLAEYARQYRMDVWAYCLMTNHVHLIVTGQKPDSLAGAIGRTHMRHARAVNHAQGWSGHLWANRFYSTPLDTAHLWRAVKYVELNPVRAGIVRRAERYPWSSAAAHCGLPRADMPEGLLSPKRPFPGHVEDWSAWLAAGLDETEAEAIRRNTYTGRPCGAEAFINRLEKIIGRPLRPAKRGRKPKDKDVEEAGIK